ncbi:hypothetical protein A2U01_0006534, partial [Trifolium medium]|nr:hypothetical protein [Trifolium medium]
KHKPVSAANNKLYSRNSKNKPPICRRRSTASQSPTDLCHLSLIAAPPDLCPLSPPSTSLFTVSSLPPPQQQPPYNYFLFVSFS